jgi:hypothetical protein
LVGAVAIYQPEVALSQEGDERFFSQRLRSHRGGFGPIFWRVGRGVLLPSMPMQPDAAKQVREKRTAGSTISRHDQ